MTCHHDIVARDIAITDGYCPLCLAALNAELVAAMQWLVADVDEYERVNNLAPNPGKLACWQSMTQARAALAKAKA